MTIHTFSINSHRGLFTKPMNIHPQSHTHARTHKHTQAHTHMHENSYARTRQQIVSIIDSITHGSEGGKLVCRQNWGAHNGDAAKESIDLLDSGLPFRGGRNSTWLIRTLCTRAKHLRIKYQRAGKDN